MERERGSALVMALLITLVLGVIVTASLSRCLYTWTEMGRSYHHASALYAAEAGVEKAVYALNHKEPVENPEGSPLQLEMDQLTGLAEITELAGQLPGPSGEPIGTHTTIVEHDPTSTRRVIITSQGMAPPADLFSRSRATRMLRVVAEMPPQFPQVIRRTTNDAVISETFILTNGDTRVSGNTRSGDLLMDRDPDVDADERVTQNLYEYWDEDSSSVQTAYGEVHEDLNSDEDSENDVFLPFDEFTLEQYKEIAIYQGHYYDYEPTPEELPKTFFQEDGITPNVIFITSSIHLSGGYVVGGLIFIVGDVITDPIAAEFGGNNLIEGIIYTTGHFWGHGGGAHPFNVNGAVFAQSVDIRGNTMINYEWQYYHALMDPPQPPPKYRFTSWQELIGPEQGAAAPEAVPETPSQG